ncbi:MAG: hypothetical protein RBG13Loki_0370 [Promethearchaeota archaeon CR_4]|nr:MAG: hypothetical protein RBG13Loki_0370 [Candidatus Lokiarchaeota archaeon CR_4]
MPLVQAAKSSIEPGGKDEGIKTMTKKTTTKNKGIIVTSKNIGAVIAKTKRALKGNKDVFVRCPKCHARYIRAQRDVGQKEQCGICVKMVVLEKVK